MANYKGNRKVWRKVTGQDKHEQRNVCQQEKEDNVPKVNQEEERGESSYMEVKLG